jgi:hypothetical protein
MNLDPIKFSYGISGQIVLDTIEQALKSIDEKIKLIYREKEKNFIIANTGDTKQEAIEKEIHSYNYEWWEPVISKDDQGNLILSLKSSGSPDDSDSD